MHRRTNLCDSLIKLDKKIRFVGIVSDRGEVIQGGFKKGVLPMLEASDEQQIYVHSLQYMKALDSYKKQLGSVKFSFTEHEKVSLMTFPLDDGTILCISSNSKINHEKLKAKVLQTMKQIWHPKSGKSDLKRTIK